LARYEILLMFIGEREEKIRGQTGIS
jgi:hypothetical protein